MEENLNEMSEDEELPGTHDDNREKGVERKYRRSVVDDRFFSLAEMEEFLDEQEKHDSSKGFFEQAPDVSFKSNQIQQKVFKVFLIFMTSIFSYKIRGMQNLVLPIMTFKNPVFFRTTRTMKLLTIIMQISMEKQILKKGRRNPEKLH